MSIFTFWVTLGPGLAPVIFSWVEANPKLEWRWIQWFQMSESPAKVAHPNLTSSHFRSLLPFGRIGAQGDSGNGTAQAQSKETTDGEGHARWREVYGKKRGEQASSRGGDEAFS